MARPRKVGLDYFSHDTDVSTDDKIEAMEVKYGPTGYALYFKCLERIYRNGGPISIQGVFRPIMSSKLKITEAELEGMIQFAIQIELLVIEQDGSLMSEGARKRLKFIEKGRETDRNRVPGNNPDSFPPDNSPKRGESKGKEIKGKETKEDPATSLAPAVIEYLNKRAGKAFRNGAATSKLIAARAKEGYTLEDFKRVIDNKVTEWGKDPKMEQYIRPVTLFQASKFDAYLNQKKPPQSPPRFNGGYQRPSEDDRPDLDFLPTGSD
jgi:uncharacterized phage protein (TIGR02220 family)